MTQYFTSMLFNEIYDSVLFRQMREDDQKEYKDFVSNNSGKEEKKQVSLILITNF